MLTLHADLGFEPEPEIQVASALDMWQKTLRSERHWHSGNGQSSCSLVIVKNTSCTEAGTRVAMAALELHDKSYIVRPCNYLCHQALRRAIRSHVSVSS